MTESNTAKVISTIISTYAVENLRLSNIYYGLINDAVREIILYIEHYNFENLADLLNFQVFIGISIVASLSMLFYYYKDAVYGYFEPKNNKEICPTMATIDIYNPDIVDLIFNYIRIYPHRFSKIQNLSYGDLNLSRASMIKERSSDTNARYCAKNAQKPNNNTLTHIKDTEYNCTGTILWKEDTTKIMRKDATAQYEENISVSYCILTLRRQIF